MLHTVQKHYIVLCINVYVPDQVGTLDHVGNCSNSGVPKKRTAHSFPTQAKNFLHGLVINLKHTLKESPIHHQNYIELKTNGVILMGDVDERKEDDGGGVF